MTAQNKANLRQLLLSPRRISEAARPTRCSMGRGPQGPPPQPPHSCARAQGWASWGARDGALRRTPIFGIKARSAGKWGPSDVKGWTRRGPQRVPGGRLCPAVIVRDHPCPQARAPGLCDPLSSPGAGSAPQKSQAGQSVPGAGERDARNPARPTRQRQTLWRGRGVAGRGATPLFANSLHSAL